MYFFMRSILRKGFFNRLWFSSIVLLFFVLIIRDGFAEDYKIKKGDTLYGISKRYKISIDDIKKLNGLKSDYLKAGNIINLPTKEQETENLPLISSENNSDIKDADIEQLDKKDKMILFAKKFLNTPYRLGGSSIIGIDCSAYVQKVFDLFGISLPRTAREQFGIGDEIQRDDLTIGDLVFFTTYTTFPSHVGIYIGDNLFIHASSKDRKVKINNLDEPYYSRKFLAGRRLFEADSQ